MIREDVYINRDNRIDLLLKADNQDGNGKVAQDLSSILTVVLKDVSGTLADISSAEHSGVFDWSTPSQTGVMWLTLGAVFGAIEDFVAGDYIFELILYDDEYTNGIVFDRFAIRVATS